MKKITQEWISKAEEDYLVATRELEAEPPALKDCRDDLIKLSAYAVDVRYPGFRVSKEEARECVESMEKIQQVIRNHFKI